MAWYLEKTWKEQGPHVPDGFPIIERDVYVSTYLTGLSNSKTGIAKMSSVFMNNSGADWPIARFYQYSYCGDDAFNNSWFVNAIEVRKDLAQISSFPIDWCLEEIDENRIPNWYTLPVAFDANSTGNVLLILRSRRNAEMMLKLSSS